VSNQFCKIFWPDLTKTFHVKHFGPIDTLRKNISARRGGSETGILRKLTCAIGFNFGRVFLKSWFFKKMNSKWRVVCFAPIPAVQPTRVGFKQRTSRGQAAPTTVAGQQPLGSSHRPTSRAMNGHWGDAEGPAHSYAAEEFMQ